MCCANQQQWYSHGNPDRHDYKDQVEIREKDEAAAVCRGHNRGDVLKTQLTPHV